MSVKGGPACCQNHCVALHWRHDDHDSVSNHQPHGCLLNRLFRRRSKKTSKLRVTGLCVGNSPGPMNSPHKGPVTRKMFPFDDAIMWLSWINLAQSSMGCFWLHEGDIWLLRNHRQIKYICAFLKMNSAEQLLNLHFTSFVQQADVLLACFGRCNREPRCKGIVSPMMRPIPCVICNLVVE